MQRRGLFALLVMPAAVATVPAWAHPMPNSMVIVEMWPGSVRLVVSIPMSEMAVALGSVPDDEAAFKSQMLEYLTAHASIHGSDGRPWAASLTDVASAHGRNGEHAIIIAVLSFTPATGGSVQARTLRYDAVNHRVASHYVLVYRRIGDKQVPLGRLQTPTTELKLP